MWEQGTTNSARKACKRNKAWNNVNATAFLTLWMCDVDCLHNTETVVWIE
jgi:hypothetical protein